MAEPLRSLAAYSQFVAEVVNRPTVHRSTLAVWSESSYTGTAEGEIWFSNGLRLRVREEIDFHAGLIHLLCVRGVSLAGSAVLV